MSEMIERVAAALKAEFEPYRLFDAGEPEALARAAIAAMREPTEAMVATGNNAMPFAAPMAQGWRAMIDAALK